MKLKLLFILCPFFVLSQTQIGDDINGEALGDWFGASVSVSSDGNILAIGALRNDGNGENSGHVRVYRKESNVWTQIGNDIDGEGTLDLSGRVSLSSNGSVLAIGAALNNGNGSDAGHVRIFRNENDVWTQIGNDIDGDESLDFFGTAVNLSSDGSVIAIGASNNDGNGPGSGLVRVFRNDNDVWTQIGSDIYGEAAGDLLGRSVSLSSDGNILAIGANENDDNGPGSGHVRVYKNNNDVWTQIGGDIDGEAEGDFSGWSVSLSSDGDILAIGAIFNDANGSGSGQVRVYRNENDVWTQIGSDIDGEDSGDWLGSSINLSSDGSILALGAPYNDGNGLYSGYVRIYKNINDVWIQIGSDINGDVLGDVLGSSVSLSSDGSLLAIGAPQAENGETGYVRVYDFSDVLSVKDLESTTFNIYPNPTKNQFSVELQDSNQLEKVSIYNTLGQLVLTSKETTVDTSSLSSGSFIVKVTTNQGKSSKKLIIE